MAGERTAQAYEAGVTGGKVMKFEGTGPGGFTGARVVRTFGEDVIDPRIWNDIIGNNRMNGRDVQGKGALLGESTFKAMKFEEWPDSLVALAGLQYLRQSTSKAVKTISSNMLCPDDELPRTKDEPEAISRFWSSKMAGAQNSLGIAYFLGYRDKITRSYREKCGDYGAMNTPIIIKLL